MNSKPSLRSILISPAPAGDIYVQRKGRRYETDVRGLKALKVVRGAIETAFEMGLVATNLGQICQQSCEYPPVGILNSFRGTGGGREQG